MDRGRKHVQISFDDLNRIRILDPEHFKQTEGLADECVQFNESTCGGGGCNEAVRGGKSVSEQRVSTATEYDVCVAHVLSRDRYVRQDCRCADGDSELSE